MKIQILHRLLLWITARLPAREIRGEHGEPYLERYYVCSLRGWRVYIHRFLASDPDRGLHDHPWDHSTSLVLAGGYRELRTYSYRILRPGHLNRIRGHDFHRILLDPGREAWTLFLHGPRTKGWGFRRNGEYTPFAEHKDDYPAARWWETAPCGRELRRAHVAPPNRAGETSITLSTSHGFKAGDIVEIQMLDQRRWKRLWHFVTFRAPPMRTERRKIASVNENTFTV